MIRVFRVILMLAGLILAEGVEPASARLETPAPQPPISYGTTNADVFHPSLFFIDLPESYDWQQVVSTPSNAMFGVEVTPSLTLVATVIWYFLDPDAGSTVNGDAALDVFIGARHAMRRAGGQYVKTSTLTPAATRNFSAGMCRVYTFTLIDRLEPRGGGPVYNVRLDGMACVHPDGEGIILLEFSERYPEGANCHPEFRRIGDDFFASFRFAEN